jgi:hypothetical protein
MKSRRQFIQSGAMALSGLGLTPLLPLGAWAAGKPRVSPADRINVGAIGINGMGWPISPH